MTQVTVDAENLWFILQQYRNHLDNLNNINSNTLYPDKLSHVVGGSYNGEYQLIKQMEQQIREVI